MVKDAWQKQPIYGNLRDGLGNILECIDNAEEQFTVDWR
jgi:hypothetical protein